MFARGFLRFRVCGSVRLTLSEGRLTSLGCSQTDHGFHIGDSVSFLCRLLDDIKEWSGLFFDAHQLSMLMSKFCCQRQSFDADGTNVKNPFRKLR